MKKLTSFNWSSFKLREVRPLVVAGFILLGCILPWTVRNYVVYGRFLLLNSNTGYAMYSAQHPMHGTRFREFDAAPLPEGFARGNGAQNEAEMDKALMRLGIGFVLDDPVRYLRLSLSRVRAYFEFWPTPDTTLIHNLGRVASYGLALPFMIYGLMLATHAAWAVRSPKSEVASTSNPSAPSPQSPVPSPPLPAPHDLTLLLLFITFYSLLHILTWAMVRYRLPVDAVTLPFAALALVDIYAKISTALNAKAQEHKDARRASQNL